MKKLLISILILAGFALSGCSSLRNISWLHHIDIQQGNVVTQDQVDNLQPNMTRRQVLFLMGTPLVADAFHENRWDYLYTLKAKKKKPEYQRVTLVFNGDNLAKIEGDLRPNPNGPQPPKPSVTLDVPPYKENRGILERLWDWTFGDKEA